MASRRLQPSKLEEAEAWWALIARVLAFFLGAGMLSYETLVDRGHAASLIVAGIVLLGVPIAGWAEAALKRLPGGK